MADLHFITYCRRGCLYSLGQQNVLQQNSRGYGQPRLFYFPAVQVRLKICLL